MIRKENFKEKLLLMLRMITRLDLGIASKFRFHLVTKREYKNKEVNKIEKTDS
jgi:hypothetical protein